jgi:excinuclease ABC subunit B
VGINLLREGLDLPEVALVAILDADKEGFLRSASSLIQTMGRAARNVNGRVVMYADTVTDSMRNAIGETQRRRARQIAYNEAHGIDPQTITKSVTDILERVRGEGGGSAAITSGANERTSGRGGGARGRSGRSSVDPRAAAAEMAQALGPDADELSGLIHRLDLEMTKAAEELRFEEAALLRDEVAELRALLVRDPVDGSPVLVGDTADVDADAGS